MLNSKKGAPMPSFINPEGKPDSMSNPPTHSLKSSFALDCSRFLAFKNGILDLKTGQLLPHSALSPVFYQLNCNYAPENTYCPGFLNFLDNISGGDPIFEQLILEAIGYSLSQDTTATKIFLLQGIADSGMQQLMYGLHSFFNKNIVASLNMSDFTTCFASGGLHGTRLCLLLDSPTGGLGVEEITLLKQLCSCSHGCAEAKYEIPKRIWISTNHPLNLDGDSLSLKQNIVTIPFRHPLPRVTRVNLIASLPDEREAIATLALQACIAMRKRCDSFCGEYALNECFAEDGIIPLTFKECVIDYVSKYIIVDDFATSTIQELYEVFVECYPNMSGISASTFASQLYKHLDQSGFAYERARKRDKSKNRIAVVYGLRLNYHRLIRLYSEA